jgi:glucose-1-phosphate cytidylyltransferase
MKVLILAGGFGTRISEESELKPKPMIEIGGKPILWHIMKMYSFYGYNEFVILCGYKGYVIKEYFSNYYKHMADMTINLADNVIEYHKSHSEPWKVTLVDTGLSTMTGGRIARAKEYIGNDQFMLTYGDGLADLNIKGLVEFHQKHGRIATLTSVQPDGRFGILNISPNFKVESFEEKPKGDGAWINAGFMVCQPEILEYLEDDQTVFEQKPLRNLAVQNELRAFKHTGFWQPMDTLRDKILLEGLIKNNSAPWIKW